MFKSSYVSEIFLKEMWPNGLNHIPCPPEKLFIRGLDNFRKLKNEGFKFLTIVGSRKHTDYGAEVCQKLISGLTGYKICIVSGLAYGIDALAHRTALENDIKTLAFPGSGLNNDVLYPQGNFELAQEILESGGCLISEFENNQSARPWMFPQRNRLMVGICDGALIIEAGEKSGSGITANMAVEYNRNLMAVPGSIFNHNSKMTNRLIQSGAYLISDSSDILENLGFDNLFNDKRGADGDGVRGVGLASAGVVAKNLNSMERAVLNFVQNGLTDRDQILHEMKIPISELNRIMSKLEIEGLL